MTKKKTIMDEPEIPEMESAESLAASTPVMEMPVIQPGKKPRIDLNNRMVQISLALITIAALIMVGWGINSFIIGQAAPLETLTLSTNVPDPQVFIEPGIETIKTDPAGQLKTAVIPEIEIDDKPRTEVITYEVVAGDSIFLIADKFGLLPETVLWANRYTLGDTPDGIGIGTRLFILPVDGLYHMWDASIEGLNGVSEFYGVKPEDIINYPLNNLDMDTIGNWSKPNIATGTMLIVPGGRRPTVSWVVSRENPAVGSTYLGPGACTGTYYGAVGTGTYVFPTDSHALSGYDWNPPVHNGLDFEGRSGWNIYAVDSGVVVFSGWSDRGYGNLLVIDHDGVQSYYAHLIDGDFLPCGSNVTQGERIAGMGSTGLSTGPHLHFELRFGGTAVNPWLYLH